MVQTRSSSSRHLALPGTPGGALSPRKRGAEKGQTEEDLVKAIAKQAEIDAQKEQAMDGVNGVVGKYLAGPSSSHYEFGGPLGAVGISVAVLFFSYFFHFNCSASGCPPQPYAKVLDYSALGNPSWWRDLFDAKAAGLYLAWYAWCVVCWAVLPGKEIEGTKLRDGQRLKYKINSFGTLVATLAAVGGATFLYGPDPLVYLVDHIVPFLTAAVLFSFATSVYCFVTSSQDGKMLALGGNTPSPVYNWFIGRELNPRIGSFDLKSFNELRPGMVLWAVIDLAYAAKQYTLFGSLSDSMYLVVAFHLWYIVDALFNEPAIFTTMDITTDGFGFMLSVGDLVWVPFTYSLQARYLAYFPKELGALGVAGVLAVQAAGYYVFRTANGDKNNFRNGKNPKNLKSMTTSRGTKLIISGLWGLSRHPNYLGDWIMAWAWCLPTGFDTPLPYYYVVYFAILLVHRQLRDDEACAKKYGEDWKKYTTLVPSRIVPYIY